MINALRLCLAVPLLLSAVSCRPTVGAGIIYNVKAAPEVVNDISVFNINKISDTLPTRDKCIPKLEFWDEKNGWLACANHLWQTQDGGREWETVYADERSQISDFYFNSLTTGWGVWGNTAHKTKDGGRSWIPVTSIVADKEGVVRSVKLLKDGKHGWAVGGVYLPIPSKLRQTVSFKYRTDDDTKALAGAIFYTEDGGESWQRQFVTSSLGTNIKNIAILNRDQVWVFGDAGLFHFQGKTWKQVKYKDSGCPNQNLLETTGLSDKNYDVYDETAIFFLDSGEGWLSFANGYIAKSNDKGQTWCDLMPAKALWSNPDEPRFFTKIYFIDSMNGLGYSPDGTLYQTKDGGMTWEPNIFKVKFNDIYFSDSGLMWGIAKEGLFSITYRTGT